MLLAVLAIQAKQPEYVIIALNERFTKDGYIATTSEKYLDDVIQYAIDKDYEAINKLINAGVAIPMKKDVKVYLVKVHVWSGTMEFRLSGSTKILWTVREGLKCN
jgi:hypothetical protein